jgi:hypothetical protein
MSETIITNAPLAIRRDRDTVLLILHAEDFQHENVEQRCYKNPGEHNDGYRGVTKYVPKKRFQSTHLVASCVIAL